LATAVGPEGHVYTHDIEEPQFEKIKAEIKEHSLECCVTPHLRDVCTQGFQVDRKCHAIFLDLPTPWLALPYAIEVFDRSNVCRLVSFSPCIEQTQELCERLNELDFHNIKTVELIGTTYKVSFISKIIEKSYIQNEKSNAYPLEELEMSRSERKRKAKDDNKLEENGANGMASDANTGNKHPILMQFPHQQPTHAGYLTSATLFPK
jgi:tRNA (adenine57-N1/adenine58-N1)-methyltransferase